MKAEFRVVVLCLVVVGLVGTGFWVHVAAQEAEASRSVSEDESGRLPAGYAAVVTKAQRKRIYEIQDQYQKQIEELNKQIAQIAGQRDQAIAGVLDEEQTRIVSYIQKLRERERKEETAQAVAPAGN